MSGSVILSPNVVATTLLQDGQAAGSITAADVRQQGDSLGGLATSFQGGNYTFVLADRGTMVEGTSGSAQTFTVPPNSTAAFQVGTVIAFRQYGTGSATGQLTIAAGAGVTLRTASSLTTRAQYSIGSIHKRGTDEWIVSGDMT
jgi:hypothetical protein